MAKKKSLDYFNFLYFWNSMAGYLLSGKNSTIFLYIIRDTLKHFLQSITRYIMNKSLWLFPYLLKIGIFVPKIVQFSLNSGFNKMYSKKLLLKSLKSKNKVRFHCSYSFFFPVVSCFLYYTRIIILLMNNYTI